MKLRHTLALVPFILAAGAFAETANTSNAANAAKESPVFQFSTEVSREVEKDLMHATVFARKSGKSLPELKKTVSANLNQVMDAAKKHSSITLTTEGVRNHVNYDEKGKVNGWIAEGYLTLKGKNFEEIASVLENLPNEVAISSIDFSVSPETLVALEDEMTLDIIKQFQHKAEVIQKGLNAKSYAISNIQLETPNGNHYQAPRAMLAMSKAANFEAASADSIPLEAGKETISARASGSVKFE